MTVLLNTPTLLGTPRRAVCLDLADKADVLEYYSEDVTVRSVREEFYLPAVLRVRTHRSKAQHTVVSLSRSNILLRDRYQCQYCGSGRDLTIGGWGGWVERAWVERGWV